MDISKYKITNIRRGKGNREKYIYAELRDENDVMIISATLAYIQSRVNEMSRDDYKGFGNEGRSIELMTPTYEPSAYNFKVGYNTKDITI